MGKGIPAYDGVQSPWQLAVRQFMIDVKELELPRQPVIPSYEVQGLCKSLIQEEAKELYDAMAVGDIIEVADAIADLLYVTLYTANACGIWIEPIFREVQRSNMTKKGGPKREDGKQLKPSTYEPPNLQPILERQIYDPISYIENNKPVGWLNHDSKSIVND